MESLALNAMEEDLKASIQFKSEEMVLYLQKVKKP